MTFIVIIFFAIIAIYCSVGYPISISEFERYVKPLEKRRDESSGNSLALKKVFSEYEKYFAVIKGKSFELEGIFVELNIISDEMRNCNSASKFIEFARLMSIFDDDQLNKALGSYPDIEPILNSYVYLTVAANYGYTIWGLVYLPQLNAEQRETLSHFRNGDKIRISGILRYWGFENKAIFLKVLTIRKLNNEK